MVMEKTIKVDGDTLEVLSDLKVWYAKQDHKAEITFDRVINELMFEHTLNTNPEIQQKKKDKLLEGYVTRDAYNTTATRGEGWMKKYLALERENSAKKAEFDDKIKEIKANANFEMTKCQDTIKKLQRDLTNKEKEIVVFGKRNNELRQKLNDIKTDLGQFSQNYYDAGSILLEKHFKSP